MEQHSGERGGVQAMEPGKGSLIINIYIHYRVTLLMCAVYDGII